MKRHSRKSYQIFDACLGEYVSIIPGATTLAVDARLVIIGKREAMTQARNWGKIMDYACPEEWIKVVSVFDSPHLSK